MIRIEVNKDISKTKDSFLGPLSFRQTISLAIGLLLFYLVYSNFFSDMSLFSDQMTYIAIPCIALPVVIGCVPIHGLPFEQFIYAYLPYYLYPRKRAYNTGLGKDKTPHKTVKSKKRKLKKYV